MTTYGCLVYHIRTLKVYPYDQLLTYNETTAYLKISKSSLMRMIHDSENPLRVTYLAERVTRIKLADIYDWLEKQNEIYNRKLQNEEKI